VRGLSIGFAPLEMADIAGTWGTRFLKWEWLELSAVTIPANAQATIQTVKSFDQAASGPTRKTPGASGSSRVVKATPSVKDPIAMKTYTEQIAAFEATRASKAARMDEIMSKSATEGVTLNKEQEEEYDGLDADVKDVDAHLVRLRAAEERAKQTAVVVRGADPTQAAASRSSIQIIEPKLEKGIGFARLVSCKMAAFIEMHKGNFVTPLQIAKQRYPSYAALHQIFEKTAVPGGSTSGSHDYDDLVPYQVLASDFIDYLRPKTIIGKFGTDGIPALRRVPFNVRVGGFSAGTTGYWKGEGKPIPVSRATSENVTLTWATAAGLTVMTQELMRFSTPSAEQALRDDLAGAIIARTDVDFVDPTKAAVANTSPASITYGIAATAPSGTAAVNVRHDLAVVLQLFAQALQSVSGLAIVMSDTMATAISMMVNTLGQPEFPQLRPDGGSINGIPVIVSEHLTAVGSPSTQTIVVLKPSECYLADDGQVTVDASMEAAVEMSDAPGQDGIAGTGASMVSLWQSGLIGLRAERVINWKLRRSNSVQYISPAAYTPPTS
jgi:HK97 family phage major capsid protein